MSTSEKQSRSGSTIASSPLFGSRSILERLCYGVLVWARKGDELVEENRRLRVRIELLRNDLKSERQWLASAREELSGARYLIDEMRIYIRKLRNRGACITYSRPVDHIELRYVRPRRAEPNHTLQRSVEPDKEKL